MNRYLIPALLGATAMAMPALAQDHSGMNMPGMSMPAPKPAPKVKRKPVPKTAPKPIKKRARKAAPKLVHAAHQAAAPVPQPAATPAPVPAMPMEHSDHGTMDMSSPSQPAAPAPSTAQPMAGMDHSGHDMAGMNMAPDKTPSNIVRFTGHFSVACPPEMQSDEVFSECWNSPRFSEGSGTSRLPANDAMHGQHIMAGDWMLMVHGNLSLQYTDHSGPRGDSKTYVTSMAMVTGTRDTGWGRVQLKSMFSLEPAMDSSGYPNLFATGETSNGLPLVDRQHPHDLFMELAARVDINAGAGSVYLYGGPVGEPALGPSAFMHRGSAANNPEAPITHHWFDSTHITYGVVTVGYSARSFQLEASAFRGQEPDERRWNIETPKLDSWSVRATYNPSPAWSLQASYGQLKQPEALHPGEDEHRFTASAHYGRGGLSAMAAFSSKKRVPGETLTAWLGEVNWDLDRHNSLFGRVENVANDELFPNPLDPLHDTPFRVTKFQAGYARHVPLGPVELTLGGSLNAYAKPAALDAAYGQNPMGFTVFARISLGH